MLIIFDVDGTLIGGEPVDWKCFRDAFQHVTGQLFPHGFFDSIDEVTAKAIVHQALPDESPDARDQIEQRVCHEYLVRLQDAHADDADTFAATTGAIDVLAYLNAQDDLSVAIATGDWVETISFKMGVANIGHARYPMATSSDCYARADIIQLAAQRAGSSIEKALYIGDGLWDYRATQKLGIPFLGVGHRYDQFINMGVVHALQSLEPKAFTQWFEGFRKVD